ncbi:MAG: hypothetical protein OFPII_04540 [Osedax symbiont Rs1]|nr:MAG: hypothetical protein OFPII_04540 [Osedax symbiont Rs1]
MQIYSIFMLSISLFFTSFSSYATNQIDSYSKSASLIENAYNLYQHRNTNKILKSRKFSIDSATDLWKLPPSTFQLNLNTQHPRVKKEIKILLNNSQFISRSSYRARPYYRYILKRISHKRLPAELALLPFIESGYNSKAISSANAKGTWQFIPSTAAHFGLKDTQWYDARGDILVSTEAALTYLTQLNRRFDGDWLLALAAYNCGPTCVTDAQKKNRDKGKRTNFWALELPFETRRYVPKFLAINAIIQNASRYTIRLEPLPNKKFFDVITIPGQMNLSVAANLAGIPLLKLTSLNAGIKHQYTDPKGPHRLLIPVANSVRFRKQLLLLPKPANITKQKAPRYETQTIDLTRSIHKASKITAISSRNNKPATSFCSIAKAGMHTKKVDFNRWGQSMSNQTYLRPNQTLIMHARNSTRASLLPISFA